ncbi:MFS transporter [Sphingorhabdus sp. SMR4y]|uniref:MFS transporter n=1 Tax=Sphingorhabdus sp. SMR4y TaxID=2584094 RepID=UPI000B61DBD5|nr:MFS transporter [Sphingorhabdus sp. SMR4y]ASK87336.1 muropeptide transporter [Sphingorhabdus sp. SMR4y]
MTSTILSGATRPPPSLETSRNLRLFTIFLLYAGQGIPLGLFDFTIPAWMAVNGASAADIAFVVAMVGIPWSFKFVAGFVMDRYTLLSMGRRRVWIIGAQAVMISLLVLFAIVNPGPDEVLILGIVGLAVNTATVFQDVAVDGLTVDILPEEERSMGGALASGGQVIGIAVSAALTGTMVYAFGASAAYVACGVLVLLVTVHIIWTRERVGERRLPWTEGETQEVNRSAHAGDWLLLLKGAFRNSLSGHSLAWFPNLLVSGLTYGICIIAVPLIATGDTGWTEDQLGSLNGTAQLVAGIVTIAIGGFAVGRIGAQRSLWLLRLAFVGLLGWMIWSADGWSDPRVLMTFVLGWTALHFLGGISDVVINMRLSPPAISATQFSIFMAVSNMGISLAGILVGSFAFLAEPGAMLLLLMVAQGLSVAMLLIVNFPTEQIGRPERATDISVPPAGAMPARD